MRKRKIRIVCDGCPINRNNCCTCVYSYGVEGSKIVYCDYSKEEAQKKRMLYDEIMRTKK